MGFAKGWGLVRHYDATNQFNFSIINDDASAATGLDSPTLSDGWHHIAIVRQNQTFSMYIDGNFIKSIDFPVNLDGTAPLEIGVADNRYAKTTIDEFHIYNRVLSQEEINEDKNKVYDYTQQRYDSSFVVTEGADPVSLMERDPYVNPTLQSFAYYPFDEGSGLIISDSSGNNPTGALNSPNGPTWTAGKYGSALSFDGINDSVTINDSEGLHFGTSDFTISLWMKFPIFGSGQNWAGIINKGMSTVGPPPKSWALMRESLATNKMWFQIVNDSGIATSLYSPFLSNGWHHIAIVRQNHALSMYIDGSVAGSRGYFYTNLNGTAPLQIGVLQGTRYIGATIDEFHIYKRALSQAEIQQDYVAPGVVNRLFNRYFYVENVNRDASGDIVQSGGTEDLSTQKITVVISWGDNHSLSRTQYITRYQNRSFVQSDWSGGSGQEGPITLENNKFANSSNIDYTTSAGSISAPSLSSAELTSSIFDISISTGVAINTIMWQGVQVVSANVQFQIASDSISTPTTWNYKGPDGTNTTYYTPTGPNIPIQVNLAHHNNHRFFRYKIFLSFSPGATQSPRVDDVIINYSK